MTQKQADTLMQRTLSGIHPSNTEIAFNIVLQLFIEQKIISRRQVLK